MIRNLDYWQPASAPTPASKIVTVNNNNNKINIGNRHRIASAIVPVTVTTVHQEQQQEEIVHTENNNEQGFGDKNGGDLDTSAKRVCRKSTVIVKMTSDGSLVEEQEVLQEGDDDDDLIEEEELTEGEEVVIEEAIREEEEPEEEETKALDSSVETRSSASTTITSTSANSSFEDGSGTAASVATVSPDHHARRPMNAFLIFCKKHRPIVREKYPNLENRAITKILGDWWANLEKKDQDPFKSLASNYKDAFLSANPTFKWYKLPAPPLRTLSTRPTNADRSYGDLLANGLPSGHKPMAVVKQDSFNDYAENVYLEPITSTPAVNRRRGPANKDNMQIFKLADENQMGGLSNLMGGGRLNDNNNNNHNGQDQMLSDNEADMLIEEGGPSYASSTVAAAEEPFANMRTHAARMEVTPKRKLGDVHSEFQAMKRAKKRADYLEATSAGVQQLSPPTPVHNAVQQKSSPRACKGKKYLEFIKQSKNSATAAPTTPPSPPPLVFKSKEGTSAAAPVVGPNIAQMSVIKRAVQQPKQIIVMQQVGFPHNGYCKPQPVEIEEEVEVANRQKRGMEVREEIIEDDKEKSEQNNSKLFDASDFELDSKITALPALSLDTYLTRKRETKKKKKIGGKGKPHAKKQVNHNSGPTIHEVKEALQKVGSQKRKARKESITRRDVNSLSAAAAGVSDEATGNASDLLILATLAAGEIETHQK